MDSNHLVNECREVEVLGILAKWGFNINKQQWVEESFKAPGLWLAILLKFYIWKEYTNTTYGDHLANPKW